MRGLYSSRQYAVWVEAAVLFFGVFVIAVTVPGLIRVATGHNFAFPSNRHYLGLTIAQYVRVGALFLAIGATCLYFARVCRGLVFSPHD